MIRKIKMIKGVKTLSHNEQRSVKGGHCLYCTDPAHFPCVMPNGCTAPFNNNGNCWPYTTCGDI